MESSYFQGESHFVHGDGTQNYFLFQAIFRYFKRICNTDYILKWKFEGLSDEIIKSSATNNNFLNPSLDYPGAKIRVKFNGCCITQVKITYAHITIANIYIVYEISKTFNISSYPTFKNCMVGAVSLTKHNDTDECKYSVYVTGFDRKGTFSVGNGFGRNCIVFGVDMSSYVHVNNKKKKVLILGEGPTQGLECTKLTAEKKYSNTFTENNKKICLSLHYNGASSYLHVNGTEIIKFKPKDSEIVATPLSLGNISKYFSVDIINKTGLNGYFYDFSVDYNAVAVDDMLDIHKHLMKKNNVI